MEPFRTFLFAPGNHPRKVHKVFDAGADAVILDLEDAVALAEKEQTRSVIVEALQRPRRPKAYVRVNAFDTPFCYGDIVAVVGPGLDGIVLPKVENTATLVAADWLLTQLERDRGLIAGSIDLMPIIETGRGMAAIAQIAASGTRVRRLSFGAGDYTLDMGMQWTLTETELEHARACVVLASRAAGIEPPIDTVFIHLGEIDALVKSAKVVLRAGFQGKLCIHPEQVAPVNRVFTPSDDEIVRAEKIVVAFEEAEASGSASIQVDGYFVDYPIVEKARRTIQIVNAIRAADVD